MFHLPITMSHLPITMPLRPLLALALLLSVGVPSSRADDEPESASDSKPKPVTVSGVFEAVRQAEVSAGNEHLSDLKIERIVESGTTVKKGQNLVWFETENLDKSIRDAEADFRLAELAMDADQFAHQQYLQRLGLDRAKARRAREHAQQDHDNYQKIDRERQIKSAQFSLESSEFSLDSATEEYRQLEQMYKEDDLTEESEEIVLRRAKRSMKSAEFSLERAKIQNARTLNQSIPRGDASQEDTLQRALLEFDASNHSMDNEKRKREIELRRKQEKLHDQAKKLAEMKAERKQIVLKAGFEGIFVHGKLLRGKLPAKPVELNDDSSVTGKQVIGTLLDPSRLQIRVDLPEAQLNHCKQGQTCQLTPTGMEEMNLAGVVKSVSAMPYTNGKHDCVIAIKSKADQSIVPVMTCEATLSPEKSQAAEPAKKKTKAKAKVTAEKAKTQQKKAAKE